MDEFLSHFTGTVVKENEGFRNELPSARVVALTHADHDCFIDREDEVVREMRAFLMCRSTVWQAGRHSRTVARFSRFLGRCLMALGFPLCHSSLDPDGIEQI